MPAGITKSETYSEQYIEACFYAWFSADCPQLRTKTGTTPTFGTRIIKVLPETEDGRKPNILTVRGWMDKYGWIERADALKAEASIQMDKQVVEKRVETLRNLAEAGKTLLEKGLAFLNSGDPFSENPSAAVRAIIAGAEMRFKYDGAADRLSEIMKMSDKQLEAEARRLLGKESDSEPNNENEDTIDVTLDDIPSDDDSTEDND